MRQGVSKALCSAILLLLASANGQLLADNEEKLTRHNIAIGQVASVEIPSNWLPSSEVLNKKTSAKFTKRRVDWHDCLIDFEISAPIKVSPKEAEALRHAMSKSALSEQEALSLTAPFNLSQMGYSKSTVTSANNRNALRLRFEASGPGPCEPMPNGGRRRPMLHRDSLCVLIPISELSWQAISFQADTMGDVSLCTKKFDQLLQTIIWR